MADLVFRDGYFRVILARDEKARRGDCRDCWYLRGAVNLWCGNEEAAARRGTYIPGVRNCPYWKEARRG